MEVISVLNLLSIDVSSNKARKMNVIVVIVLMAVCLESISASRRRVVYTSPPAEKTPTERQPTSNITRKTNVPDGNVATIAGNISESVAKLPLQELNNPNNEVAPETVSSQPAKPNSSLSLNGSVIASNSGDDDKNVKSVQKTMPNSSQPNISGITTQNAAEVLANIHELVAKLKKIQLELNLPMNDAAATQSPKPQRSPCGGTSYENASDGAGKNVIGEQTTSPVLSVPVPYLKKGKVTIVEGKYGKVFVDDVFLFDFDDELKKGKFRFKVNGANDVFVNDRLVLRKRPEDDLIIRLDPNINEDGISKFNVRIDKYGYLHYTSNKGLSKIFAAGK